MTPKFRFPGSKFCHSTESDVKNLLAGLKRVEIGNRLVELPTPAPDTIVLYNQHNGPPNNTGAGRCNLTLYSGKRKVWERKEIRLEWKQNEDPPTFVRIPDLDFDRLRVDITKRASGRNAGGLSEVEVLARGVNLALGLRRSVSPPTAWCSASTRDAMPSTSDSSSWAWPRRRST